MKRLFRFLGRAFGAGIAFGVGLLSLGVVVSGLNAATINSYTGPGGTNPVINPSVLADLNSLVTQIKLQLTPSGTGTVPAYLALTGSPTSTTGVVGATASGMLDLINPGSWSFNTSTACGGTNKGALAGLTGTTACLVVQDVSGTVHYIPAF